MMEEGLSNDDGEKEEEIKEKPGMMLGHLSDRDSLCQEDIKATDRVLEVE